MFQISIYLLNEVQDISHAINTAVQLQISFCNQVWFFFSPQLNIILDAEVHTIYHIHSSLQLLTNFSYCIFTTNLEAQHVF